MNYLSTFIYLIQLVLYYLISEGYAQGNVKNIIAKVLKTNCTVNGRNNCGNKYLQICFNDRRKQMCVRTMPSDCLLRPYGFDTSSTDLTAVVGSNSTYDSFIPITSFTYIVVGITATTTTARNPLATSCEESRTMTKNGFRVKTRSADGYQFEILIENICTNLNSCGLTCGDCVPTTTLSSKMDTSDISTNAKNTFKTVSIPRLTSTELSDETTTTYTTNQASSEVTGSSSPKATSEESSTIFSNVTNNSTSNLNKSENSSKQNRIITLIIAPVGCIVVIFVVVIMIYKCYRKHNRMSRTTPSEDDKNRLVENDNTAGEDAHSSTGHLNSVQNHKENRYKEHASSEDMAHVTTETVDETVNSRGDGNESISSKQNETNDIPFEIVNSEHENNELSNIITETPEDIEHENNGMKTVISMHVNTEVPSTHQHKKKKKKKRSDAEEDMPSISEDVSVRYFPADEQNVNANGQNNGYIPDDEHSDAAPSNESGEVSVIDVPTSDNGDVLHQEQTYDDFHHQAQSNGDVPCQAQSNGDVPYQAPSNSGIPYQAQSNGDVPDQAQSNGDFHHPEISKEETENNAQAKMETFIHGKMCEIRRDITEDTNNSINQVKEEFTEKMRQQSDEIKEQISRNRADLAKAETKRKKKMQKMKDRIKECKGRLKKFQDENMKNQIEFDKRIKASGGKQDDARQKIKENINAIQKLRDEMNRLKEDLKQQISQHRSVSSATDSPSLTQTSQINESSPHTRMETQDLSHSITNSDDAAQSRPTGSLVSPGIPPASRNRRKKKKKEPSIHVTRDGSVQIKHKNNKTINFGNMGSIEILNVQHGVGFTADSLEVEVKSTDYDVI